ncbi:hypothetical protein HIMB100_00008840 [SAR116 cluster alpha proteobacterium HIMB100]|nr:hypothetical protein HIMB100_00008840 [SAR116 cluster alpha proteobacterium HIMB100]
MPDNKPYKNRKSGTGLAVLFALTSLIVIAVASYVVWRQMGQIELGLHGWIALVAGSVGMVVLGGGLMALSFYSARSGHDEAAWQDPDDDLN